MTPDHNIKARTTYHRTRLDCSSATFPTSASHLTRNGREMKYAPYLSTVWSFFFLIYKRSREPIMTHAPPASMSTR